MGLVTFYHILGDITPICIYNYKPIILVVYIILQHFTNYVCVVYTTSTNTSTAE